MGLLDRDWYWDRRKARANPDDDYLFPDHHWPDAKRARIVGLVVAGAVVALLAIVALPGVFDRVFAPSRAERLAAENKALGYSSSQPAPIENSRRRYVPPPTAEETARAESRRATIVVSVIGLALLSPLVALGLLVALFVARARGPAALGLVCGIAALIVGPPVVRASFPGDWVLALASAFAFFSAAALCAFAGAIVVRWWHERETPA